MAKTVVDRETGEVLEEKQGGELGGDESRGNGSSADQHGYVQPNGELGDADNVFGLRLRDGQLDLAEGEIPDIDPASIPTVEQRIKEAKLPVAKSTRELMDRDLLLYAWRPQEAMLANTGEVTQGYFVLGKDLHNGEVFTVFIGGIALCRMLRNVAAPMVARIEQKGRALVFR